MSQCLTVGGVRRGAIANELVSAARWRVDFAITFILTTIVVANPNIDLIVIAAGADVRHDQILLEVWKPDQGRIGE